MSIPKLAKFTPTTQAGHQKSYISTGQHARHLEKTRDFVAQFAALDNTSEDLDPRDGYVQRQSGRKEEFLSYSYSSGSDNHVQSADSRYVPAGQLREANYGCNLRTKSGQEQFAVHYTGGKFPSIQEVTHGPVSKTLRRLEMTPEINVVHFPFETHNVKG